MSDLTPGTKLLDGQLELAACIATDDFGTIWRASHGTKGDVLAVCYNGAQGAALFAAARTGLDKWKLLADTTEHGLLKILEVNDGGAVPVVVVEAAKGATARTAFKAPATDIKKPARLAAAVAGTLHIARTYELVPANVSPDTVIEAPGDAQSPWRLIPVAPLVAKNPFVGGLLATQDATNGTPDEVNEDVYGLTQLWIGALRGDFSARWAEAHVRELPYSRLRTILSNALTPRKGRFPEPKLTQIGAEQWLRGEADEDIKEHRAALAAEQRAPWKQKLVENQKVLTQLGVALAVVLVIVLGIIIIPKLVTTEDTRQTPYGAVNLYWKAMVDRDLERAKALTSGEATAQTDRIMERITAMEQANLASRFAAGVPQVRGDGNRRTVKVDVKGEAGDLFMEAEMTIAADGAGNWTVEQLFFKELRAPGQ